MNGLRHYFGKKAFLAAAVAGIIALTPSSSRAQINLSADYSSLGTVYQDAAGLFYNSAGAGRTDITSVFETDISAAFSYFSHSLLPTAGTWSEQISFTLFDLGTGTVGDSAIDTIDANGRPATSSVRFNIGNGINYFVDPTPFDNSEFDMSFGDANLGGGTVNNKRFGDAVTAGVADGRWDFLTLVLHETEHSLGISRGQSSGFTRFLDLVGPDGTAGRQLTIPNTLSGLPNDFDIPVATTGAHFIGSPVPGDTFGYMTTADPGWQESQRALPTALDFLALARVEGLTAGQVNTNLYNPAAVPEPGSIALFVGMATVGVSVLRKRRKQSAPSV